MFLDACRISNASNTHSEYVILITFPRHKWLSERSSLLCSYVYCLFDIHGSVHRRWLSRNTNKMQLCNRIYYSKVYWRLNMFQAAHRSSSGALWWPADAKAEGALECPLSLGNGRSPYGHINQKLQIQFRAPDDERCAAGNMLSLQ